MPPETPPQPLPKEGLGTEESREQRGAGDPWRALLLAAALALPACGRDAPPEPSITMPVAAPSPRAEAGPPEAAGVRYLERTTGGASASDTLPLVIAVHGLGDRPESFAPVYAGVRARARLILPYGLDPWGEGFSWFPIGALDDPPRLAEGTSRAADRLAAMIAALVRARPTAGRPIVTGFSQGGMLSFTLAVRSPEAVGAAFPIGGLIALPLVPAAWPVGRVQPEIHAFHGDADDRVPVARVRATVERLRAIGLGAELTEYPGVKHAIPAAERADVARALDQAIERAAR
jgi:phospholipase/carboxylesterase